MSGPRAAASFPSYRELGVGGECGRTGRLCFGVVDEGDIVRDFIEYHTSLGIERFIATDVGSTDGTLDILAEYERSGRLHLTRLRQSVEVRAENRDWLTAGAVRARDAFGAAWCVFADPDEFWVFPTGDAPGYLQNAPAPIAIFPRYNMLPLAAGPTSQAAHHRQFDLVVRRPLEFLYDLSRLDQPGGIDWMLAAHPPDILRFIAPKVAARADIMRQGQARAFTMSMVMTDPAPPSAIARRKGMSAISRSAGRSATPTRRGWSPTTSPRTRPRSIADQAVTGSGSRPSTARG